jgi:hypothetical protein
MAVARSLKSVAAVVFAVVIFNIETAWAFKMEDGSDRQREGFNASSFANLEWKSVTEEDEPVY